MFELTTKALDKILSGQRIESSILQILAYKKIIADHNEEPRYRFILSDGKYFYPCCFLAASSFDQFKNNHLDRYALIKLNRYAVNLVNDKKVLVMLEIENISKNFQVDKKIGNPVAWSEKNNNIETCFSTKSKMKNKKVRFNNSKQTNDSLNKRINFFSILPISQLCPYQSNWAIRGRVVFKSPIRIWNNFKGHGKFFSFILKDYSGEIKVTAFKNECDSVFDFVKIGKIYQLSRAQVKIADKKFNPDLDNDYEINLISESLLELDEKSDDSCPQLDFDFIKIAQLEKFKANDVVDVVGICRDVGEIFQVTSKKGKKELRKRSISLIDESEVEVEVTLWNDDATNFDGEEGCSVILKKARVSDFQGKTLTTGSRTLIQVNPNLPIANGLRGWYNRRRFQLKTTKLTIKNLFLVDYQNLNLISKEKILSSPHQVLFINVKAFITQIGRILIYSACSGGCKKKLFEMNNGLFKCDKCNKTTNKPEKKIIMNLALTDATKTIWVSVFNLEAEKILSMKAEQLDQVKYESFEKFQEAINQLNFKSYILKLKSKVDSFKEKIKTRSFVISADSVNIIDYSFKLIEKMKQVNL